MNEQEWNFATYMACLGHSLTLGMPRNQPSGIENGYPNADIKVEEQKVFAELRPANGQEEVAKNCNNNANMKDFKPFVNNAQCFQIAYPENLTCVNSSTMLMDRVKNEQDLKYDPYNSGRTKEFEKQLVGWNLGVMTESGVNNQYNVANILQPQYGNVSNMPENNGQQNGDYAMQGFERCINQHECYTTLEEDFKFPASVEEQYTQMLQNSEVKSLPCIESIFSMMPVNFGKENANLNQISAGNVGSSELKGMNSAPLFFHGMGDRINTTEDDPHMYEAREVEADTDLKDSNEAEASAEPASSNNANKVENIEQILEMINPTKDIMGKTFHKIPSTTPIYTDNEARQIEVDDDNRIRRPMNAFMLWARKYRYWGLLGGITYTVLGVASGPNPVGCRGLEEHSQQSKLSAISSDFSSIFA